MLCPPCWQLLQLDTFRLVKAWLKTCRTVQGSPCSPEGSRVRAQTARQFIHTDPRLYGDSVSSSPRSWAEAGPATSLRGAARAGWTYPLQLVLPLRHHLFLAPGEDGLAASTYWFCILIWQGCHPSWWGHSCWHVHLGVGRCHTFLKRHFCKAASWQPLQALLLQWSGEG